MSNNLPQMSLVYISTYTEPAKFMSKKTNQAVPSLKIEHNFTTIDGKGLQVRQWLPDGVAPEKYKADFKAGQVYTVAFSSFKSSYGTILEAWADSIVAQD